MTGGVVAKARGACGITQRSVTFLVFLLHMTAAVAAPQKPSFEDTLPDQPFDPSTDTRYFTLAVENDSLGSGSDRHYTSGVRATWLDPGKPGTRFAERIMGLFGKSDAGSPIASFVSIGQNLYTPNDITLSEPDPEDRPYAAFLYASRGYTRALGDRVDSIELTVGMVGPAALGEWTQSTVHQLVDAEDPQGWDRQLDNEPGLAFAWERRWPERFSARLGGIRSRFMPHTGVTVGNVYTHASTGLTWQILPDRHALQALPLRVRPALPGSGFFYPQESGLGWSAFAGIEARAVARNIFLDGNSFEDSPSVDRKSVVIDASAGFSVSAGRTRISYTLNWRSDEFEGQRDPQLFGALSISRRF